ncbi:MAG: FAD-dependent oxidoreductase [Pseudomonadales bacterium]
MNTLETDVVVIGSGATGFAAALTARTQGLDVHIFEKAEVFGGTTALSGGVAWVPGNHLMASTGGDSAQATLSYLKQHVGNRSNEAKLAEFVAHAPRMLALMTERGYLKVGRMVGFPDYHAETPGGDSAQHGGGRSVEPLVFSGAKLGDWQSKLRYRARNVPIVGTMSELRQLASYKTNFADSLKAWRAIPRSLWGKLTGANHLSMGAALIGWLAHGARQEGIELHLATALRSLLIEEDRVQGVVVAGEEGERTVLARRGVILASGGFDHNAELRAEHLPSAGVADHSSGAGSNTGDGQLAALEAGAGLGQMDDAWWAPTCLIPGVGPQIVIFERGKPGQIIVDGNGQRFTNEARPYGDFVRAMFDADAASGCAIPAFMVFDQTYRDLYPIGHLLPGVTPQSAIDDGFLTRAASVEELAGALAIDANGLAESIRHFNVMARDGRDADHGRGEFAFDRYGGDSSVAPNPCLAPIERAPFYAIKIYPGDLGAHGGVLTNEHAQALDASGQPIDGLYAVGNCAASALGGFYPGAGGTIGPGMTFGYVAAMHLARAEETSSKAAL